VVVKILEILLEHMDPRSQILMTASTHNGMYNDRKVPESHSLIAVDNVLERFAKKNTENGWVTDEQLVRAATDANRVGDAVRKYTVDAMIGGSPTDDPRLIKKAEQRIKQARIILRLVQEQG
jgi:hypothetical protein